jgi:hypothetical protein
MNVSPSLSMSSSQRARIAAAELEELVLTEAILLLELEIEELLEELRLDELDDEDELLRLLELELLVEFREEAERLELSDEEERVDAAEDEDEMPGAMIDDELTEELAVLLSEELEDSQDPTVSPCPICSASELSSISRVWAVPSTR